VGAGFSSEKSSPNVLWQVWRQVAAAGLIRLFSTLMHMWFTAKPAVVAALSYCAAIQK